MIDGITAQARTVVAEEIVPLVDRFRSLQDPTGRVMGDQLLARGLLDRLHAPVRHVQALLGASPAHVAAFEADLGRWLARGLDTPPEFDETLATYSPPADHRPT